MKLSAKAQCSWIISGTSILLRQALIRYHDSCSGPLGWKARVYRSDSVWYNQGILIDCLEIVFYISLVVAVWYSLLVFFDKRYGRKN